MSFIEGLKNSIVEAAIPFARLLRKAQARIDHREHEHRLSLLTSVGADVCIHNSVTITDPPSVTVGNNVHIGSDTYIMSLGGLQIRDNVHIGQSVTIYCSDHDYKAGNAVPYGPERVWSQVIIEKNVWIGMNACILPGVTIGEGAIVGVGAVISEDVPPRAIVGQQPHYTLGARDSQQYAQADAAQAFGGRNGAIVTRERQRRFLQPGAIRPPKMCFVLTTGRSGSTTIARMLNRHPTIVARHEHRRQMIKWSTDLSHGNISAHEMEGLLRQAFLDGTVYRDDRIYVESDQKYFNCVPILTSMFPDAKFIWLVRSATRVVSSIVGRGWYADETHPAFHRVGRYWHDFRLCGDLAGSVTAATWEKMSQFEMCCWYWKHVNEVIERDIAAIPTDKKMILKLEDFGKESSSILDFLELPTVDIPNTVTNQAAYKKYDFDNWTPEERQIYDKQCGPLMSRLYGYQPDNVITETLRNA